MRLCMPTINEQGLGARLSPHFGSAPYYTLVDRDTGDVKVLKNENARHEHGRCAAGEMLKPHSVDAVICRELGRRALSRLTDQRIQVFVTDEITVSGAVDAFQMGAVSPLTREEACRGGRGVHHH